MDTPLTQPTTANRVTPTERSFSLWGAVSALLAFGGLFGVAVWLRLITIGQNWPVLWLYDETQRFQNTMWIRGDRPPIADAFGIAQSQFPGWPPLQLWIHAVVQRIVEANVLFPVPADYILGSRYASMVFGLVTLVLMGAAGYALTRPLGARAAVVAAWISTAVWAFSAPVILVTNIGVTDPLLYPYIPLAIMCTVYALRRDNPVALVWSLIFVILAIYTKYVMVYLLWLPGMAAAVLLWRHGEGNIIRGLRTFWPWVAVMAAISVVTAGWLVLGWGALGLNNVETRELYSNGLANALSPQRWFLNLYYVTEATMHPALFVGGLALGFGAWWVCKRRGLPHVEGWLLWVILPYVFFALVLISSIEVMQGDRMRYTISVFMGVLLLWSVGLAHVAIVLRSWHPRVMWAALVLLTAALAVPSIMEHRALAAQYSEALAPQLVWEWADASLPDDGKIMIYSSGDANRWLRYIWDRTLSGYNGPTGFQYNIAPDANVTAPDEMVANGFAYLIVAEAQADEPLTGEMLLLKRIETERGAVMVYRAAVPENPIDATFGEAISLVGYDLRTEGDNVYLRPYWRADMPPGANYSMFAHLTAPDNPTNIIAQYDGPPARANRLTPTWSDPDEVLIGGEVVLSAVAGDYSLRMGLYDFETGGRLPLSEGSDAFVVSVRVDG